MRDRFLIFVLSVVPTNYLSALVGWLVRIPLPGALRRLSVRIFARLFSIDTSLASRPLDDYESIGAFFIRDLRPGVRPVASGLVSPVDGTLRACRPVENGQLEQIKGKNYDLEKFLGDRELAQQYREGIYFNFYLSPQDYHHVHAPCTCEIEKIIHIPGVLWPVNDWSVRCVDDLFVRNERVVICLRSEAGPFALVMVGATNVGKISLTFDPLISNRGVPRPSETFVRRYSEPKSITAGSRLGTFHMGSSVVLLCPAATMQKLRGASAPRKVVFGEQIAEL